MTFAAGVAKWLGQAVGLIVALPAILIGGAAFVVPASPAWAAPFGCTSNLLYPNGNAIHALKPDGTIQTTSTGSFAPYSIAMSPSGELYSVTIQAGLRNRLYTIADDGTVTDLGVIDGLLESSSRYAATFLPDGDLLLVGGSGRAHRVNVDTLTATEITTANTQLGGDIAAVDGQVYASSSGSAGTIYRFDVTTGALTPITVSNASGFSYPSMWSVSGHLYVGSLGSPSTTIYEILDFEGAGPAQRVPVATTPQNALDGASCTSAPNPFIDAADDDFQSTPVSVVAGGFVGNVSVNDTVNAQPFFPNDVVETIVDNDGATGAALDANGGLSVPAGTAPGTYELVYKICKSSNTAICDTATATFVVARDAVDATDDAFGKAGGNVLTNDTVAGNPADPAGVALSITNDGGLTGATLDPDGKLNVPAAAAPGTYNVTYQLCQNGDPTNCDTATAVVTVPDPNADDDKDGIPNPKEKTLGSNPNDPDTDNDGLKDGTEYNGFTFAKQVYGCDRVKRTIGKIRTSLLRRDSDGDGLNDRLEVFGIKVYQRVLTPNGGSYLLTLVKSHPVRTDTDGDGLKDKVEVTGSAAGKFGFAETDPANCHTDFGKRSDGYELSRGKNPVVAGEA